MIARNYFEVFRRHGLARRRHSGLDSLRHRRAQRGPRERACNALRDRREPPPLISGAGDFAALRPWPVATSAAITAGGDHRLQLDPLHQLASSEAKKLRVRSEPAAPAAR